MTRFTTMRLVAAVVLAAAAVLGVTLLAPGPLGGTATWVSTSGVSMHPGIRTGDLVIARPRSEYDVGDVVAYRSDTLDSLVLHRVVADTADGLVTRGDNNDWVDPDRPQTTEILGAMWLHIPGGGRMLDVFADPFVIAALIAVLLTSGSFVASRRSRGRRRRRTSDQEGNAPMWMPSVSTREYATVAAVAAVVLSLFAFGRPTVTEGREEVGVKHTAQLSYSAPVSTPDVYAENRVSTGDPVLLSVVSTIDTRLRYDLGFDPGGVSGTISSVARLTASNGWSQEIPIGRTSRVDDNRVERSLPLDFSRLLSTVRTAEQRAQTSFGSYSVALVHRLDVRGTVDGREVTTSPSPAITFSLTDQQAVLQDDAAPADGTPITKTETSSVVLARTTPATVTLLGWSVPISGLRVLALVLALAALGLFLVAARGGRVARRPGAVFGGRLVRASHMDFGDRPVVDVADEAALARLATRYDTAVLHVVGARTHLFLVVCDETVYRCSRQVGPADRVPAAPGLPEPAHDTAVLETSRV